MSSGSEAQQPTLLFKLLTLAVHTAVVASSLALQYEARNAGPIGVHLAVIHAAMLFGLWGPSSGASRFWWVPSPAHEPLAMTLLIFVALIHFIGVGVVSYHWEESSLCTSVNTAEFWAACATGREPPGFAECPQNGTFSGESSLEDVVAKWAASVNCTISPTDNWTGPNCDACGGNCEPCGIAWGQEWYQSFDDVSQVSLDEAMAEFRLMAEGSGCEYDGRDGTWRRHWSFLEKLWFCIVLLTTVGYGNTFVPTTPVSRQFTLIFALYGLLIFGAATSAATEAFAGVKARVEASSEAEKPKKAAKAADDAFEPPAVFFVGRALYIEFVLFLLLNFMGAGIFFEVEDGWHFVDALYHAMMTATTIGLGDIAPQTVAGRSYGILHMLLSVVLLGRVIGAILGAISCRAQLTKKEELVRKTLDVELIASLDKNGNGVDKTEFVLGMLEILGVVEEHDYKPFLEQFARLDKTGDGVLNHDDLVRGAEENKAAEANKQAQKRLGVWAERVRQHAKDLVAPAFIASFSFLWYMLFGQLLMAGGLVHGLAIGIILGAPPSKKNFYLIAAVVTLAALLFALATACMILYVADYRVWQLDVDPLGRSIGTLSEAGLTSYPDDAAVLAKVESAIAVGYLREPSLVVILVIYGAVFVAAILIDIKTIACCMKAAREASRSENGASVVFA